uniref:Homologous recombination OB-fold protein OB-fold domain-containing protein n=1 Tax=Oryza brachyantha TaxID=4533 RepID=J3MJU8_ORYBR
MEESKRVLVGDGNGYLGQHLLAALAADGDERSWKRQEIAAIRRDRALYRARLVVGMVTSCMPNRLGDLFLSLKDPSGTIGASVHQKVFAKEDGMVVSVGSVIVLKKVAVFRPSHKACYLNITEENLEMLVPKDFPCASKQVISSSPSESQHLADTLQDCTLRMDKGSTQGVENHQGIRLQEKAINPSNKNKPTFSANQQLQKTINSISPANVQQRRGSPCSKYGSSRIECSTNNIMMRLLGGERNVTNSREMVDAEVYFDHGGTADANNSTSIMDSDTSTSGKHQGIGHQTLMERLGSRHISNHNGEEHHQQSLGAPENPNTRCSQPSLGGCSVMPGTGDSVEASSDEKRSQPAEGEWMLPSSKKLRTDPVLPDNVMSSMNVPQEVHVEHASINKPNECQPEDLTAGTLGIVLPSQENSSASVTTSDATSVSASLHLQPTKLASVNEWTDDQLSELFLDY